MNLVIWLLTFVLVILSVVLVLLVLMQKSKSDGGVGAALGGGMTEATFGADTGNVLATLTRNGTIAFFVIAFGLYLAHIHRHSTTKSGEALPSIAVPATPTPAATPEAPAAAPASETAAPSVTVPVIETPSVTVPSVTPPATTEPAK